MEWETTHWRLLVDFLTACGFGGQVGKDAIICRRPCRGGGARRWWGDTTTGEGPRVGGRVCSRAGGHGALAVIEVLLSGVGAMFGGVIIVIRRGRVEGVGKVPVGVGNERP